MSELDHPNIIRLYGCFETEKEVSCATEEITESGRINCSHLTIITEFYMQYTEVQPVFITDSLMIATELTF